MKKEYIKYIAALLLFGSNGIVASNISLSSYEIVFWRTMIGSALLVALFLLARKKPLFPAHKKDLLFIALSGIAMGASWIFLYEAYAQVGVGIASLAYYCGPVIVMILSPFIFKEKMTAGKVIGFSAVLAGILLVNGKIGGDINHWGVFCGLMSALMYSVMVILNKKSKAVKGLENATIQLVASFITVTIFTAFRTGFRLSVEPRDWVWIAVLGLLNTGIGCYLYFSSIGRLPVQTVAVCGYLEPLSAVLLAVIILGENMTASQCVGAVLIVGGAVFGECFTTRKNSS